MLAVHLENGYIINFLLVAACLLTFTLDTARLYTPLQLQVLSGDHFHLAVWVETSLGVHFRSSEVHKVSHKYCVNFHPVLGRPHMT